MWSLVGLTILLTHVNYTHHMVWFFFHTITNAPRTLHTFFCKYSFKLLDFFVFCFFYLALRLITISPDGDVIYDGGCLPKRNRFVLDLKTPRHYVAWIVLNKNPHLFVRTFIFFVKNQPVLTSARDVAWLLTEFDRN